MVFSVNPFIAVGFGRGEGRGPEWVVNFHETKF